MTDQNPLAAPGLNRENGGETVKDNDLFAQSDIMHPELRIIGKIVAEFFGLRLSQIKEKTRKRHIAQARQIASCISEELTHYSSFKISKYYNYKNHSSMNSNRTKVNDLRDAYPKYRLNYQKIRELCANKLFAKESVKRLEINWETKEITINIGQGLTYQDWKEITGELRSKEINDYFKIEFSDEPKSL